MENKDNKLKFYLGEESHYIVEKYEERETSVFAEQYKKAFEIIDGYINAQGLAQDDKKGVQQSNIVAFTGDRGTGKTSCMLSVLNMLDRYAEDCRKENRWEKKTTFANLDIVDPSFFTQNTNILFLVVGKMFANVKKAMEGQECRMGKREGEIHDLLEAFQKVQFCLSRMDQRPIDCEDDLNQLGNLLVTVELKEDVEKLVCKYLHFFKSDYLVVPVDDIDISTEHAYEMLEQLRKYLALPKVIILISFKLEQIIHAVDLYFTKLYSPLQEKLLPEAVSDMTQKYLLKLFPFTQRIALLDMSVMMDRTLEVYESHKPEAKPILPVSSVKYTLTDLIFKKTRYLFYHASGETCPIVPANLREYRTLLGMLCRMSDYRKEKEEYNKFLFREYFYGSWVNKNLDAKGQKIARRLIENHEAGTFNKLVLEMLRPKNAFWDKDTEIDRIMNPNNAAYNVSIGDVFAVLGELRKQTVKEEDKKLLFFIESLYSIKLYHYYDEVTEPGSNHQPVNKEIDESVKRVDVLDGFNNYAKLVGGDFFNPEMLRFLPEDSKSGKGRAYRVVNIIPLKKLLDDAGSLDPLSFNTIEFFALTLSRRLQGKSGGLYSAYRQLREVYYRDDFKMAKKAVFDLGSFFSNITDMEKAYNRLHEGFYEKAKQYKDSLLNKLIEETIEREGSDEYDNNRFLSWCCIRNAVILQEFGNSFRYVLTGRSRYSDQLQLLQNFFQEAQNFGIKTYDRQSNGNDAYKIKFDYVKVLVAYFKDLSSSTTAEELFYEVFGVVEDVSDDGQDSNDHNTLDVDKILYHTGQEIRKKTLKGRILKNMPELKDNTAFWEDFDEAFPGNVNSKISKVKAYVALQQL